MTLPSIAVVGTGPVGRALAAAYVRAGGDVAAIVSRSPERAAEAVRRTGAGRSSTDLSDALAADVALVAVPDRALSEVAARIAAAPRRGDAVLLHTSGSLAGDVFAACGRPAGSLHPLQSFPDVDDDALLAERALGAHWFHEGDGAEEARALVAAWRGTFHRLAPGAKALYHAGAATLSNHAVALFDAALDLFERAGVPRDEAHPALAALFAGTSANVAAVGVPAALTGPVARGDVETVARHLDAMRRAAPDLVESYVAMARRALVVAKAKGSLPPGAAEAIGRVLGGPPRGRRRSGR